MNYDLDDIILLYSYGIDEDILQNNKAIIEEMGFQNIYLVQAGGVITTHSGPAGFGIIFYEN